MRIKYYSVVVAKLNNQTGKVVLFCGTCDVLLAMTTSGVMYCPQCKRSENSEKPEMVLCCSECKNPLSVSPERGSYCETCDIYPSMQERFFKTI